MKNKIEWAKISKENPHPKKWANVLFYLCYLVILGLMIFRLINPTFSLKVSLSDIEFIILISSIFAIASFPEIEKKGCLTGKSEKQKIEFFKSLYEFKEKDLIFYNEQLHDLKPDELEQFNCWVFDNTY